MRILTLENKCFNLDDLPDKLEDDIRFSVLDNSDTKHNPYNIIPSNNITMDGVSIPLMLMPDGDKARVVMPNSGEYNFPNSQYVTEIPLAQEGRVNRKNYQPSKDVIIQDGEFTDVSS